MRIALTGGIGSGKSTVARLLAEHGAVIVDADAIAREIVEPGEPALNEIREAFGDGIITEDGRLDRAGLASVVFADSAALERLNAIMHPRIAVRSSELLSAAPAGSLVVYDMPLLVEQGLHTTGTWEGVIVVDAPDDVRLARLVERGMEPTDAHRRMAAQSSRAERLAAADYVVDNSTDRDHLAAQVADLWIALTGAASGPTRP